MEIANKLEGTVNKIVYKKEEIIMEILPDITLDEISQRCSFVSSVHEPDVETLTLDGERIITFYPIQVDHTETKDGVTVKVELPYFKHE